MVVLFQTNTFAIIGSSKNQIDLQHSLSHTQPFLLFSFFSSFHSCPILNKLQAGHYAMRSPLCLQQLHCAVDLGIPVTVCNIFAGIMPDFMEEALQGATFVDFVPSFMPATVERGQASFENSFEEMVATLVCNEQKYVDELPVKMSNMIGRSDAFNLSVIQDKPFCLIAHGGCHREFSNVVKEELERHRIACVSVSDTEVAEKGTYFWSL